MIANRSLIAMPITYALALSEEDYKKLLHRLGGTFINSRWINEGKSATTHFFYSDDVPVAIVCMQWKEGLIWPQCVAMLVHEAVHIWQESIRILGEEKPSDEFMAYGIQGISQELMELYRLKVE